MVLQYIKNDQRRALQAHGSKNITVHKMVYM